MDLSGILELFGHSVYDPKIDNMLQRCNASCDNKSELKLYDSSNSQTLGVEFWFWWKGYYRDQIGDPQGTVEPEDSTEVVLKEVRLMPEGLENTALPFGLSFPATQDSVIEALGRKPFSKSKNFAKEPFWTYYEDGFELLAIFNADGEEVRCFKIFAMKRKERQKIAFLESLTDQKKNILPDHIPEIEASLSKSPLSAWEQRMNSGDSQISTATIEASRQVFEEFVEAIAKAVKRKNAKSLYTAVTKATKAFNKIARQHTGFIETLEREEIVEFFNAVLQLTGLQFDPSFDLTEEHRSW